MEASGKPGADVEVQLAFGSKSISSRTGSDGKYKFEQLLSGKYTVRIVPPRGMRTASREAVTVAIGNGSSTERADFTIAPVVTPTAGTTPSPTPRTRATATSTPTAKGSPAPGTTPVIVSPLTSGPSTQARQPAASPTPLDFGPSGLRIANSPTARETPSAPTPIPTASGNPETPAAAGPPPRLITSFAQLRDAAGATGASQLKTLTTDASFLLRVPFRTQIDGTAFSLVNCGPASLATALTAFGLDVDPPSLRDYLNRLVGNYDTEQGTSLYALATIAQEAGLNVFGPSGRGGYQSWTIDAIREQIRAGHPVITLTKYRRLPGHFGSVTDFDHYIVITGLAGEDFVYNDAAYSTEYGYNLIITPAQLQRAWADSSVPRHGIAVGFGDNLSPLPTVPNRLIAESLRAPNDAVEAEVTVAPEAVKSAIRPLRGPATERLREEMLDKLGARSAVVDDAGGSGGIEAPRLPPLRSEESPITLSIQLSEVHALDGEKLTADAERILTRRAAIEPPDDASERSDWRPPDRSAFGLSLALGGLLLVASGCYFGYRRRRVISSADTGPAID